MAHHIEIKKHRSLIEKKRKEKKNRKISFLSHTFVSSVNLKQISLAVEVVLATQAKVVSCLLYVGHLWARSKWSRSKPSRLK